MGFGTRREAGRRGRPGIEALERRAVPATFHATDVAQLQADIAAVNNAAGPNTIILAPGEYNLTSALKIQNAGDLTIQGAKVKSGAVVDIVGDGADRVFEVDGGNVTFSNLTIAGGGNVAQGAGIDAQGATVTLLSATVSGNAAVQAGGGVFIQGGTLNVRTSTISNNGASNAGTLPHGGGIGALNAAVTMTQSILSDNSVVGYNNDPQGTAAAEGGGIAAQGGTLTIARSDVNSNQVAAATSGASATSQGGGVATAGTAVSVTGGTAKDNSLVAISTGVNSRQGSAFAFSGGSATIAGTTLAGNRPDVNRDIARAGVDVVLRNVSVEGQKLAGAYTLGPNGLTRGA